MIDIKGLGGNVEAARAAIRKARVATARMNESGAMLERTANEIAAVFEQHTQDLLREANTLGNSQNEPTMPSGESEKPAGESKLPQAPQLPPGGAATAKPFPDAAPG